LDSIIQSKNILAIFAIDTYLYITTGHNLIILQGVFIRLYNLVNARLAVCNLFPGFFVKSLLQKD